MAILSYHVVVGRARAALNGAIDVCRSPPRGLPEAELRSLMRDAQSLAWEIEVVENFTSDFGIQKNKTLSSEIDKLSVIYIGGNGARGYFKLMQRYKDHLDRMKGLTERLKSYSTRIPALRIAEKSFEVILATEIIEACFDAALLCEAEYEAVQKHRPVSDALC